MSDIEDLISIAKELKGEKLEIETSDYVLDLLHNTVTRAQQLEARVRELEEYIMKLPSYVQI